MPAGDESLAACALYVYCVSSTRRAHVPPDLMGVDPDRPVTIVRHDGLAAFVSEVRLEEFGEEGLRAQLADMRWLERTARAHEAVLDAIRARHTLIPMRLCSIYRGESGVRQMLGREASALDDALAHLEGKTEWGVKVFLDPGHGAARSVDGGAVTPGGEGAAYLERRLRERQADARANRDLEAGVARIHERLQSIALEGLASPPQRPEVSDHAGQMILNGAYLVENDHEHRFRSEVDELGAEFASLGVDIVLTGPWPAYNFVRGTIGAAR